MDLKFEDLSGHGTARANVDIILFASYISLLVMLFAVGTGSHAGLKLER